jgi:hypothetical protein
MSRTADPFACQWKTMPSAVLVIIAFCLVTHFLVEDASVQRAVDLSAENPSATGRAFDEMGHQDDLVMAASLPESIPQNNPPAIPAWNICEQQQWAFPIRIPPKIV